MKKRLAKGSLIVISLFMSLCIAEGILRLKGFMPNVSYVRINEPVMVEYDSVLGWRNGEGEHNYKSYDSSNTRIKTSFLKSGFRKTYKTQHNDSIHNKKSKIIFCGGSFTQGLAISDSETMAWKVQKSLPSFEVLNIGTSAYSSYQSLLAIERVLPLLDKSKVVFYGIIPHHLDRNVATDSWINTLASASKESNVAIPYMTLDGDNYVRHAPEAYVNIPLSSAFSTVRLVEKKIVNYKTPTNEDGKKKVLIKILKEMKDICNKNGARFIVIGYGVHKGLSNFIESQNITFLDLPFFSYNEEYLVRGDGHPNDRMNAIWGNYVSNYLIQKENLK